MSTLFSLYLNIRAILPEHGCFTWVRNSDLNEVVRLLAGNPDSDSEQTWSEAVTLAYELYPEGTGVTLVEQQSMWTVVMEPLSCRGSSEAILKQMAVKSEAYSVYWTVNQDVGVTYVVSGRIIAAFDPFNLPTVSPRSGQRWLARRSVTETQWRENWQAAAFALGEELSGIHIDEAWLNSLHMSIRLHPRAASAVDAPSIMLDEDMEEIVRGNPLLATIVADPRPDKLPNIIRIAAQLAVSTSRLEGSLVDEAMRLIINGNRGERVRITHRRLLGLRDQYDAQSLEAFAAHPAADREEVLNPGHHTNYGRLQLKRRAVEALCSALDPDIDLAKAAKYTVYAAGLTHLDLQNGDNEMQRVLAVIADYIWMQE
ncbi:DUF6461 domain-containing protein [Spongiactinospora gelatinilytica]|uniref:DUF6461 domain-containing protein n=1 Tax=Spongiactinospora gelatinilytica TaxID=2666298 RepID=UPI0011B94AE3|nr:DUF6461 domain-containing protein [Spongiactinospora gelatinilytica]